MFPVLVAVQRNWDRHAAQRHEEGETQYNAFGKVAFEHEMLVVLPLGRHALGRR